MNTPFFVIQGYIVKCIVNISVVQWCNHIHAQPDLIHLIVPFASLNGIMVVAGWEDWSRLLLPQPQMSGFANRFPSQVWDIISPTGPGYPLGSPDTTSTGSSLFGRSPRLLSWEGQLRFPCPLPQSSDSPEGSRRNLRPNCDAYNMANIGRSDQSRQFFLIIRNLLTSSPIA